MELIKKQPTMKNYETLQDKIFEQEKAWAEAEDCRIGICECCPHSSYYNLQNQLL